MVKPLNDFARPGAAISSDPMRSFQRRLWLFIRALLRRRWRLSLAMVSIPLLIWDQRRRSRLAAMRFKCLYMQWLQTPGTRERLQHIRGTVKHLLADHGPERLHARFGAASADLALAGGGFKTLYGLGAYLVLRHAGISIKRASGASSGAFIAPLLVEDRYQLDDILDEELLGWPECTVQVILECKTLFLGKLWSYMSAVLARRLDGWYPKPGCLFVSVTTVGRRAVRENVASNFASAEDVGQTVQASMAIPFILCDGPFTYWRGQWAIDGGFMNNCPVHVFSSERGGESSQRFIVKVDANKMPGLSPWRKVQHVVYAPLASLGDIIFQGVRDMLEILSTGAVEVGGIVVVPPGSHFEKRDLSYQLLPGTEHVERLVRHRRII